MTHGRFVAACAAVFLIGFNFASTAADFPAVPGEFVIKLKAAHAPVVASSLANALGVQVKQTVNHAERLYLVRRPLVETRAHALHMLAGHPLVASVEPNYIYRVNGGTAVLPSEPELGKLWGLINNGGVYAGDSGNLKGQPGVDIDAERAWQIETGSHEVVVAVIDTGVDYNLPDLSPNIFVNQAEKNGQPGIDDDNNGFIDDVHGWDFAGKDADPMDGFGHGTHVSGTIGAAADGSGVVGVAWSVRILPIRFLGDDGSGTLADAVSAIDYATKMRANIMSNSWGGGGFSQTLLDAIERARDAGILFVAAAGNSSNNNDAAPEYPASYPVENVISVAAIDPGGSLADFSNFGKASVHIAAPGVNILSHTLKGLGGWSGTSMATPHVSGVAALLYAQDMSQSFATVKDRILRSARPLASLRGKVTTAGLLNAYHALSDTRPPPDPNDPYGWAKDNQTHSTDHPYASNTKQRVQFTIPGAKRVAVFFTKFDTEAGYDRVTFTNAAGQVFGVLSGRLGETFGPIVDGDTVILNFTSDDSVNSYGFDVAAVAYQ